MTDLRGFLARFRPAGAPGADAAVPAGRVTTASVELEPVFALLAETQDESARIREEGEREADRHRQEADERAETILTEAAGRVGKARSDTESRTRHAAEPELAALLTAGRAMADGLRVRAAIRMPALVARTLSRIRANLDGHPVEEDNDE